MSDMIRFSHEQFNGTTIFVGVPDKELGTVNSGWQLVC